MANTLDEIAYNLKNTIEGGRSHHNTYYSLDQIKFNIENYRALFLRRDLRDSQDNRNFEQRLDKTVCRITQSTDPLGNVKYVLRTKDEIPTVLRTKYSIPLVVSDPNRSIVYPVTHHTWQYWQFYNKYTSDSPRAYLLDNRLYIVGDKFSNYLSQYINEEEGGFDEEIVFQDVSGLLIYGVFEKPTEVMIKNGIDPLDVGSQEYPITKDLVQRITEGLINGELQMMMQTPSDTKHNTGPDHQLMR